MVKKKSEAEIKAIKNITYLNSQGSSFRVLDYINNENVLIEFNDDFKFRKHVKLDNLSKGSIKNPFYPFVRGIGYMGVGKYKSRVNGVKDRAYIAWIGMFNRCYGEHKNNDHVYKDCYVSSEWHDYQNFAKWYYDNVYDINNETLQLDKDILFKNNKEYSPKKCILVPKTINIMLIKCDKARGKYPIGVHYDKKIDKLKVQYTPRGSRKRECIGTFEKHEKSSAFNLYKEYKERDLKCIAELYKDVIPSSLYYALFNYKVEIDD